MTQLLSGLNFSSPGSRHSVFVCEDMRDVILGLGLTFTSFDYQFPIKNKEPRYSAFQNFFDLKSVAISYIRMGRSLQIVPNAHRDFYLLQIPAKGTCNIDYGGSKLRISENCWSVVSPTTPFKLGWSADCELLELKISRSVMEAKLAEISGIKVSKPIEFDFQYHGSAGSAKGLMELLVYICTEMESSSSALDFSGTRNQLGGVLVSLLLESQQHNYTAQMKENRSSSCERLMRPVADFIAANADQPLTLNDMASVACVSVRALSSMFQKYKKVTPMEYLKELRFSYIRSALLNAGVSGVTVTEVAMRWGMNHIGRFSAEYHHRYGEYPSETLHRK